MNNRQSYHYKTAAEKAAEEEAAARKLQMQKIARGTAKRMITRRAEQASNKERRETGQRKRNRAKRSERQEGLTTAQIRAKREKKGIGKFATKKKQAKKKYAGNSILGSIAAVGKAVLSGDIKKSTGASKKTERTNRERKKSAALADHAKSRNEANKAHSAAVKSYYKSTRKPKSPSRKPKRGKQIN